MMNSDTNDTKPKRTRNSRARQYIVERWDTVSGYWDQVANKELGVTSYPTGDRWILNHAEADTMYRISIVTDPVGVNIVTTETRTIK